MLVCVGIGDFILVLAAMFGSSPPTKGTLFASTVLEIVIAMMAMIAALMVIEFWTRCFNVMMSISDVLALFIVISR